MRVAILQSCYVPWKGYFDIIGSVDVFVVYDDVQYSKNHWHNRNLIKTPTGPKWLTVPVSKEGGSFKPIDEVELAGPFAQTHWRSIVQNYSAAPFFGDLRDELLALYERGNEMKRLSDLNLMFLHAACQHLKISTRFVSSRDLQSGGTKTDRLVAICQELGASVYLTGPSAANYLESTKFADAAIAIEWMDYSGYPEYPQMYGAFSHQVSILDLLFNVGPDARRYMKAPFRGPARAPA